MAKPIDTDLIDIDSIDTILDSNEHGQEATEIIELAVEGLEALTRAFNIISEVCEEREEPRINLDSPQRFLLN